MRDSSFAEYLTRTQRGIRVTRQTNHQLPHEDFRFSGRPTPGPRDLESSAREYFRRLGFSPESENIVGRSRVLASYSDEKGNALVFATTYRGGRYRSAEVSITPMSQEAARQIKEMVRAA